MMPPTNGSELVRRCFSAWETGDRAALEAILASDFIFSSPKDDHLSLAQYWEICWANRDAIQAFQILSLLDNEQEAFVLYECQLKDGSRFRNIEHFRFAEHKIKEVTVFFGRHL